MTDRTIKFLAILPNGDTTLAEAVDEANTWQYFLLGDQVQRLALGADAVGMVNAEGRRLALPDNPVATELTRKLNPFLLRHDDWIVGALVVVGSISPSGEVDGRNWNVPDPIVSLFDKRSPT